MSSNISASEVFSLFTPTLILSGLIDRVVLDPISPQLTFLPLIIFPLDVLAETIEFLIFLVHQN